MDSWGPGLRNGPVPEVKIMPRFKRIVESDKNGWSDWHCPNKKRYRMGCCDCGLVHDVQFKVIKITGSKKGYVRYQDISQVGLAVKLRARRNNRSTALIRKAERQVVSVAKKQTKKKSASSKGTCKSGKMGMM